MNALITTLFALFFVSSLDVIAAEVATPNLVPRVIESFEVGGGVVVRALTVEPKKNSLWVGTSTGVHEINLANNQVRNTFNRDSGLANEYVFAIGIDQEGYKWFGTNAGGTSRYRDGEWKTYFPMHGLADYWVYCFTSQKSDDFWIGTWAGANHVDLRTMKFTTYVKELINEWVYGLAVDKKDRVWFGTEGGVSMYDGDVWRSWTNKDGLGAPNPNKLASSTNTGLGTRSRHDLGVMSAGGTFSYNNNYVFSILVAQDQSVWAGTWGGGVSKFDGKRWKNYTTKEGLAGNIVYSMAQEPGGVFWFGTNGGVSRFDGKNWTNYTMESGLLASSVYAIAVAPKGDIWVGTRRGVTRLAVISH